jgi:hypothetical protein
MERRVEAGQQAELELVGALEQVLQLAEAERDLRRLPARPWRETTRRLERWLPGQDGPVAGYEVEEFRPAGVYPALAGGVADREVLLGAGDGDVEEPSLVLHQPR